MTIKVKPSARGAKKPAVKTDKTKQGEYHNYTLRHLFTDELRELYSVEKKQQKNLGEFSSLTLSIDLKEAVEQHKSQTATHVARIEKVFSEIGVQPSLPTNGVANSLLEQTMEKLRQMPKGAVRDAAIIMALQKAEHHKMACYGTLCAFAQMLNEGTVNASLKKTLVEDKKTDEMLSEIADSYINVEALIEREWES